MESLYVIEQKRREFIQEIIDRYLYLPSDEREAYINSINELNSKYEIKKRKLHV